MMNKNHFALLGFSLLFLVVFSLGCSGFKLPGSGGDGGGTTNATAASVSKGPINATVLVNGKPNLDIDLVSEQNAQVGIQLQNIGNLKMSNVSAMIIGCVDVSKPLAFEAELDRNERRYFSWDIKALKLSSSETMKCSETIRLCFDSVYSAYTDLIIVPETYQEAPAEASSSSSSNLLTTDFNFGVIRVLQGGDNKITGSITIRNAAPGWVGYINYTGYNKNLAQNEFRTIQIGLSNTSSMGFTKFGEERANITPGSIGYQLGILPAQITLDANRVTVFDDVTKQNKSYAYLLKMVGGKEISVGIGLDIVDGAYYQAAPKIERLNMTVTHGYCIDIASISVSMRGR